jgi:hypothetical protein
MCGRWIRSTIDAIQAARRGLRSRSLDVHLDIVITDRMNTYYLQIVCLAIVSGPVDKKFFFISRNSLSRTVALTESASRKKSIYLQTLKVGANDRSAQELQNGL